jgi:ADP-ribose pyrophosphatase YjhB (NUDIX family)
MAVLPYIGAFVLLVSAFIFIFVPASRRLVLRLFGRKGKDAAQHDDTPPPAHFTGWRFCPLCASRLEVREVCDRPRLACTKKQCRFVHWDNPKPVALCLVEHEGGLVLTRRKFPPRVGTWCIPGGFVEAHEAPDAAAKRETWEETGLLVEVTNLLGVYSPCQGGNEMVIVYSARPTGGALKAGDEVLELGVFKKDQLPADIGFPQHLEIIEYWFRLDRSNQGANLGAGLGIDPPSNHCDGPKGK